MALLVKGALPGRLPLGRAPFCPHEGGICQGSFLKALPKRALKRLRAAQQAAGRRHRQQKMTSVRSRALKSVSANPFGERGVMLLPGLLRLYSCFAGGAAVRDRNEQAMQVAHAGLLLWP